MTTPDPRTIITTLLLLAAAGLSIFLVVSNEDEVSDESPELSISFYLNQAELTGTDSSGQLMYRVRTKRAVKNTEDSSIGMTNVTMNYEAPSALPWDVRADSGTMPADASIITLTGNVVAVSSKGDSGRTVIRTHQLDIDPATMVATTNKRVAISFDGRGLNATGMEANFETNTLKLLSNVNGKFTP